MTEWSEETNEMEKEESVLMLSDDEEEKAPPIDKKALNPADYVQYAGPQKGTIGMEAAFYRRRGRLSPCTVAGYYYAGGWLVRMEKSGLPERTEALFVRKSTEKGG